MSDPVEKRVALRINIDHPIKYRKKDSEEGAVGYMLNESTSGVLFAAPDLIDLGETVFLTMDQDVSWKDDYYIIECQVIRHQPVNDMIFKYGMGCVIKQKTIKT